MRDVAIPVLSPWICSVTSQPTVVVDSCTGPPQDRVRGVLQNLLAEVPE